MMPSPYTSNAGRKHVTITRDISAPRPSKKPKLLTADIPKAIRKLVPKNTFKMRMDSICADVKETFYESLEKEKNDEITARMVEDISGQIEHTLVKMAEVVEIPLG